MKNDALRFLKDKLSGEVIRVIDPSKHSVEDVIASYLLLIIWLARRYVRASVELEDLVDEGIIGLLDAIDRFDPSRSSSKNAFHNLAIVRIKNYMFEYLLHNSNSYHVPTYMARAMSLVSRARTILNSYSYDGEPETDLRIFEAPGEDLHFPQDAREDLKKIKETLKKLAENSEKTYEEMVDGVLRIEQNIEAFESNGEEGSEETLENEVASKEYIDKFLRGLSPTARKVIHSRLEGETLDDTGRAIGFTRERARQVEAETLKWFRKTRMFKEAADEED